jgi:predicted nucleic-acid-binding protein
MSGFNMAQISEKFKKKREEISKEIISNAEKMASFKGLKEVQVNMLSLRQRLLEDNHTLLEHLTVLRKKYRSERSSQMENISTNLQTRYQYNEKNVIIDGKTAKTKEAIDVIENQITFFNDSIKTVDNILFGIKTRVDIEKTLGL